MLMGANAMVDKHNENDAVISDGIITNLETIAKRIRVNILETATKTKRERGAHIGPSLSCVEVMTALYFYAMKYDPSRPDDIKRDRFICSKTHSDLSTYSTLFELGLISKEELLNCHQDGNDLFGYPRNIKKGLEFEGGSLGMGLAYGVGQALAAKLKYLEYQTYVLLGDGELNEGAVWEAFMAGAHYKLANLTAIIDRNLLCLDGDTEQVMAIEPLADKLVSFGWHAISCDGHNFRELLSALSSLSSEKPTAIIAKTIKGKGVSFIENRREWHQTKINADQYEKAVSEIERVIV